MPKDAVKVVKESGRKPPRREADLVVELQIALSILARRLVKAEARLDVLELSQRAP